MSELMRAIGFQAYSYTPIYFELAKPDPQDHDLLVNIEAISVNPIDLKVKSGMLRREIQPRILGWDAMGTVAQVGAKVSLFKEGDRVFYAGDISRPGSYADYQLVDERIVGKAPKMLRPEQIAAMPLTSLTAWQALFSRLRIYPQCDRGKTILIIGAAGGVGSVAIQIAKKIAGLTVIATASRPETVTWCQQHGADIVLDHGQDLIEQFATQEINSPDYILCCADTDSYFEVMAELVEPEGAICALVNSKTRYNLNLLKQKSVSFVWEYVFTRSLFNTANLSAQHNLLNSLADLLEEGTLTSTLNQTYGPISKASINKAHRQILSGHTVGKLALTAMISDH